MTIYSDNTPWIPGVRTDVYMPDQLIGGDEKLVTENATIAQNTGVLKRGTVMGQVSASGKFVPCLKSASDGSQVPAAILVNTTDATLGDVVTGIYVKGEFNFLALTFDPSWGTGTVAFAALVSAARPNSLYFKLPVTAADPIIP